MKTRRIGRLSGLPWDVRERIMRLERLIEGCLYSAERTDLVPLQERLLENAVHYDKALFEITGGVKYI